MLRPRSRDISPAGHKSGVANTIRFRIVSSQRAQVFHHPVLPQKCPCLRGGANNGKGVGYVIVGKSRYLATAIDVDSEALRSSWQGPKIDRLKALKKHPNNFLLSC